MKTKTWHLAAAFGIGLIAAHLYHTQTTGPGTRTGAVR